MKISVPDILSQCPKKLIKTYPEMLSKLWARKQERKAGTMEKALPALPIYVFTGSRFGGKSQFVYRASISGILDGYVDSIMLTTITEKASVDSGALMDKILKEAEEPVMKSRDVERPIRILSNGEKIFMEYLNKQDSKARQQKADILIIEELEKWNAKDGYESLLTMFRHFDLIIVISNKLPVWADKLLDSMHAVRTRIDYFENEAFKKNDQTIYEGLEKLRVTDPEKWNNFIMYNDEGAQNRVYSEKNIRRLFMPVNPEFTPRVNILSIDVGGGGADNSTIYLLSMDEMGVVQARMLMDESVEPSVLIERISNFRVETSSKEEVWDIQGVGLGIAQMRFHKFEWGKQGLIPFFGKAVDSEQYFNARSEAILETRDLLQRGGLVATGMNGDQIEELSEEMRAITYDTRESSKNQKNLETKITKKEEIKKILGRSPNKLDSLTMGVWRLMTYHRKRRIITDDNYSSSQSFKFKGVPTLD